MNDRVSISIDNHVADVRLTRADKMNALDPAMFQGIIAAGEELFYDYGLVIDEPYTKALKAEYPCWCGAKKCRGTLLAPKKRGR